MSIQCINVCWEKDLAGDVIAHSVWSVIKSSALVLLSDHFTPTKSKVWITDGDAELLNEIRTVGGKVFSKTIAVNSR